MAHYNNHLFFCTNQKLNNPQCCATHNAQEMLEYAKQRAKELGLTKADKFRISGSGCMGRCEGPVLVDYPSGTWHSYSSKADIDNILAVIAERKNI